MPSVDGILIVDAESLPLSLKTMGVRLSCLASLVMQQRSHQCQHGGACELKERM